MRFFLPCLQAIALFFLISPMLPGGRAIAEKTRPHAISVQSVQADFIQEKHLPILVRPLVSRGRFLFKAPDSLRWEYTSPFHSVLLMDRGKIRKFVEKNGRLVEETGMRPGAVQLVMTEISGWLNGHFTNTSTFTLRQDGTTILLTPRKKGMAAFVNAIRLQPGDRPGLLQSVTIFEDNAKKAFTTMVFRHARLNHAIAEKLFASP